MKDGQPNAIHLKDYTVPPFLISATNLHVEINEGETLVTTTLSMRRNPNAETRIDDLVLDGGVGLDTRAITIDGRELRSNEYHVEDESLTLFGVPDTFSLQTRVAIKPQENTALEGLYKSGDMFCTQCEAQGFRNITWYLDRPDVLSQFSTTITADKQKYPILLSNGNDVARGEEGGRHWVTWEDPFDKPSYLFALVAGDLQHIEDKCVTMNDREVTLRIFTEAHNIDKVDHAMASLKHAMAWDERVYGREYDLDIFMIVAVESFNMGAMENKGLNIFNTSCVLARADTTTDAGYQRVEGVVAHEYFHNWSGDRVTCRDWFQLSLKEGFTVFRDQSFSADMGSASVCRVNDVATLRSVQFPEDAGPMAHPIRPDSYIEINNFYTPTVYEKGAEVVRMIHTLLGPAGFRRGTDLYFDRHDGQAVTTEEFVKAMEDANGIDFKQFRRWYAQAGTPTLAITGAYDARAKQFTLRVAQSCPPTPGQETKQPYHLPLAIGLLDRDGRDMAVELPDDEVASVRSEGAEHTLVLNVTQPEQVFTFKNVAENPTPSLLRGFSAPVKLAYDYTRDDLVFLMSHDADGFNRWEAGQQLAVGVIQEMVGQIGEGKAPTVDDRLIQALDTIMAQAIEHDRDTSFDKAMIAEMLVMPSEQYLIELAEVADVDAIHTARNALRDAIANQLAGTLLSIYKLNVSNVAYAPDASQIARRTIKNVALSYLMQPAGSESVPLAVQQFESADNMTDISAALRALMNTPAAPARPAREKALIDFYNRWSDEALVVDLWFQIQAACPRAGALDRVVALMQHEAFTMKNPNRLRALIGPFSQQNLVNFHDRSGAGYRFLADRVIELNTMNPQIASRILTPLTRWRKFGTQRQAQMREQMERILLEEKLSPDVFEIVSKSL